MCGRYVLVRIEVPGGYIHTRVWVGQEEFQGKDWFKKKISEIRARYDIRPTQDIVIMKVDAKTKKLSMPPATWTVRAEIFDKESQIMKKVTAINARQEKLLSWNLWRSALKHHRCIIPASAFYEWQARKDAPKNVPWEIRRKGYENFYFAGVCVEAKHHKTGEDVFETAIITQPGNSLMKWLHNHGGNFGRQPVFLDDDKIDRWLDPELRDAKEAESILRPIEEGEWEAKILKAIGDDSEHTPPVAYEWAEFITKPEKSIKLETPQEESKPKKIIKKASKPLKPKEKKPAKESSKKTPKRAAVRGRAN